MDDDDATTNILACIICHTVQPFPWYGCLSANHLHCDACVQYIGANAQCALCKSKVDKQHRNLPLQQLATAMKVTIGCPHVGCAATMILGSTEGDTHLKSCPHKPIRCPYSPNQCGWRGKPVDAALHCWRDHFGHPRDTEVEWNANVDNTLIYFDNSRQYYFRKFESGTTAIIMIGQDIETVPSTGNASVMRTSAQLLAASLPAPVKYYKFFAAVFVVDNEGRMWSRDNNFGLLGILLKNYLHSLVQLHALAILPPDVDIYPNSSAIRNPTGLNEVRPTLERYVIFHAPQKREQAHFRLIVEFRLRNRKRDAVQPHLEAKEPETKKRRLDFTHDDDDDDDDGDNAPLINDSDPVVEMF